VLLQLYIDPRLSALLLSILFDFPSSNGAVNDT
jgi:hypothetical protein